MNRPPFFEGVLLALGISVVASVLVSLFSSFAPTRVLLEALIPGLSFSYVLYLLWRSREKVGKPTAIAIWALASVACWMFSANILITLFVHIGLVWLIRALYYYASIVMALLDLSLVLLAMAAAFLTLLHTHSLFLSLWSFFLLQTLFVLLPEKIPSGRGRLVGERQTRGCEGDDRFEIAYQSAQQVLRKISVK